MKENKPIYDLEPTLQAKFGYREHPSISRPTYSGPDPSIIYGKLFGWKTVAVDEFTGALCPPVYGKVGKIEPVTTAACHFTPSWLVAPCHSAPDANCSCGIYCFGTLRRMMSMRKQYNNGLLASAVILVSVSGRVILHEFGFRAQRTHLEKIFVDTRSRTVRRRVRKAYPDIGVMPLRMVGNGNFPATGSNIALEHMIVPSHEVPQEDLDRWVGKEDKERGSQ